MGGLFSGQKVTTENIEKFKQLLVVGDTSKVPKYLKKLKDATDINKASMLYGCPCHSEAVTLLHFTAAMCPSVMVLTVCDVGHGNVNAQATSHGVTPLMYAVMHNNNDNILPLHLRRCDLHAKDTQEGDTAFHYACKHGYLECVQSLIKAGVDTEQVNKYGKTGLDCALFNGHQAVVAYIQNNMQSSDGNRMIAPEQQLKETIEKVVEEKLDRANRHTVFEYPKYPMDADDPANTRGGRRPPSGSSSNVGNGNSNSALPSPLYTQDDLPGKKKHGSQSHDTETDVKSRTLPLNPPQGILTEGELDEISPKHRQGLSLEESKQRNQSLASSLSNIPTDDMQYDTIPYIDEPENQTEATGGMQPLSRSLTENPYQGLGLQEAIRNRYPHLKYVMKPDRILDLMYARCIIDDDEHTKFKSKDISEQNDFILKKVINGAKDLSKLFIDILRETGQADLAKSIMVKKSSSEINLTRFSYSSYYHDVTC